METDSQLNDRPLSVVSDEEVISPLKYEYLTILLKPYIYIMEKLVF